MRLIDGSNITQGVLEVCFDGTWGSVCDNYWTTPDAEIACKQLGFASAGIESVKIHCTLKQHLHLWQRHFFTLYIHCMHVGNTCIMSFISYNFLNYCIYCIFILSGAKPVIRAGLGQSTGPIWLTEASCLGDEQKLVECRIDANTNYCTHSKDAGLICLPRGS